MDDALEIIKPEPDSHFRLLPCESCHSDNVAYVKYHHPGGDRWRVQCFDCGHTVETEEPAPRHSLQLLWNRLGQAVHPQGNRRHPKKTI